MDAPILIVERIDFPPCRLKFSPIHTKSEFLVRCVRYIQIPSINQAFLKSDESSIVFQRGNSYTETIRRRSIMFKQSLLI